MLIIRPYDDKDWQRICEIHDVARIDELRGSVNLAAFLTLEQSAENEGLFDHKVYVAEKEGQVLGFLAFDPEEITWLYIAPEYYRQGIGTALLDFAIAQYDDKILVEVLINNHSAFNLYKKKGFKVLEKRKGVLQGNEKFPAEGYIMELSKKTNNK